MVLKTENAQVSATSNSPSADFAQAQLAVLRQVADDATEGEIEEALARLRQIATRDDCIDICTAFGQHIAAIRRARRDSALAERSLNYLIDTTHDLSKTLGLAELLDTIVARARSLVGANLAWVTTLDSESGIFRTATAEGHLAPQTAQMTSHENHGAVSVIVKSKSYFATQDYLYDTRFQHMPELDRIFEAENIVSLAGFPILSGDEVLGVLFVADRYGRKLSGREMSVLGSFALHAAVALRNAKAFQLLSEALDEVQRNRTSLVEHIGRVEASASAHDEMTSLLASGADLQHFLQCMADQIGGAVFLYDETFQIREEYAAPNYAGTAAGRFRSGSVETARLISANSESRRTGRSVMMMQMGNEQCRVTALHGGSGRGESLLICCPGTLDPIDVRNIERSTVALSIAKLWNEMRETEKTVASSALLRHLALVDPPDSSTISAARQRLQLKADQPVAMALIAFSGLEREAQTAVLRESTTRLNVLFDLIDETYLAIGPESALASLIKKLRGRSTDWTVGGIVSDPLDNLSETAKTFVRLKRAFVVLAAMKPPDRFLAHREINLFARLFEAGDVSRLSHYLKSIIAPIDSSSARHQDVLKATLLCYFDCQHNMKRTAEKLDVHINTVRQRLDVLRQITGGWSDPVHALELHIALRLERMVGLA